MSLRKCFLSVIILLSVVQNVTAMSYLFGQNSSFSKISHFGNMLYQNRIPIGSTAAAVVLVIAYDKPAVQYSIFGICGLFLLNNQMRIEKNQTQIKQKLNNLSATVQQAKEDVVIVRNDVTKLKEQVNTLAENVQEVSNKMTPLNDNVSKLFERVEQARNESVLTKARVEDLKKQFDIMGPGIEDLNKKHTALSDLVVTEAKTTRKLNTCNTNRLLNALPKSPSKAYNIPAAFPVSSISSGLCVASLHTQRSLYQPSSEKPS